MFKHRILVVEIRGTDILTRKEVRHMRSHIVNSVIGGLIGGIVFGMMMQMMNAPTPDGKSIPMMQMVAMVVRSDNLVVGWLYHLFNSALIGAIFGWLLGS